MRFSYLSYTFFLIDTTFKYVSVIVSQEKIRDVLNGGGCSQRFAVITVHHNIGHQPPVAVGILGLC